MWQSMEGFSKKLKTQKKFLRMQNKVDQQCISKQVYTSFLKNTPNLTIPLTVGIKLFQK